MLKSVIHDIIDKENTNKRIIAKSLLSASVPKLRVFQNKDVKYKKNLQDETNTAHNANIKKVLRNQFSRVHNEGIVRNKFMLCNHDDFKQPKVFHGYGTIEEPQKRSRLNT